MENTNVSVERKLTKNYVSGLLANKVIVAYLLLLGLLLLGAIVSPGFLDVSRIMNILSISSFLGVIALGQTVVVISGKEGIDLSVGAIASLSAVMAAQIMNGLNANMVLAIVVVVLVGSVLGLVNGLGTSYFNIPPLVMTLSLASVINGIALVYTGGQPKGQASEMLQTIGTGRILGIPNIFLTWMIISCLALLVLSLTRWGKMLYGFGSNSLTADLSGVRTTRARIAVYVFSGAMSAIGGILLLGYTGTAYLDIGSSYIIPSIIAVVIGGISLAGGSGSYAGTIAGAIILTTLSSLLVTLQMGEGGRQVIFGVVLLVLLIAYARQNKG